jgi:hypothetical protein
MSRYHDFFLKLCSYPLTHSFYLSLKWEYLSVEWGSGNDDSASSQIIGYAHPIEDSNKIDSNFCLDLVAGMLQMV